ncbi:MAG: hypothetical protein ACJ790_03775 [Myxococcaceae bacterium]
MRAGLLCALLLFSAGCINFQNAFERCHDGGACESAVEGGGGGGSEDAGDDAGVDAGGGGGDGGAEGPLAALVGTGLRGPICTNGYCWEHPLPSGNALLGITSDGPRALIVGDWGTIELWNGQSFEHFDKTLATLLDVVTEPSGRVTIGGTNAMVELPGTFPEWPDPCQGDTCDFRAVWATPALRILGGYFGHPVFFELDASRDGNYSAPSGLGFEGVNGISGPNEQDLRAVMADGRVLRRNGVGDWTEVTRVPTVNNNAIGICVRSGSDYTVARDDGVLLHSSPDGGFDSRAATSTLAQFRCGLNDPYFGVFNDEGGRGRAVRCDDTGCRDAGLSQEFVLAGAEGPDGTVWFAGYGGVISSQDKSGTHRIVPGSNDGVFGLAEDDAGVRWAVGTGELVMRGDSNGWTIDSRFNKTSLTLRAIAMIAPATGYIVTSGGVRLLSPASSTLRAVSVKLLAGGSSTSGFNGIANTGSAFVIVGDQGFIAQSRPDGGFESLRDPVAGKPNLNEVFSSGDGVAIAVGDQGAVERIAAGSVVTLDAGTSTNFNGVWGTSSDDFFVVGEFESWGRFVGGVVTYSSFNSAGNPWFSIAGTSATDLVLLEDNNVRHGDGTQWDDGLGLGTPTPHKIFALPSGIYVTGARGMIMKRQP